MTARTLCWSAGCPSFFNPPTPANRAWRREAYVAVGGHARGLPVADDYDLILRTLFQYPSVYLRHMLYVQVRWGMFG